MGDIRFDHMSDKEINQMMMACVIAGHQEDKQFIKDCANEIARREKIKITVEKDLHTR